MKKVLLGTSAIALAGAFASQANAAEWNMRVGGYLEEYMIYTNTDSAPGTDYNGIDNMSDGEIHFKPEIVMDNGLKFGARIELEGATNSDQIDENYAYIDGSFGRIVLGEDDNVAYTMSYAAPDVSFWNINSGSDTNSIPFAAEFGTTSTYPSIESDSAGIRYFTPRLAGFQLGASYARDANKATDDQNKDENAQGKLFNIWAVAANYVNTIGDVSIAASAGYTSGHRNGLNAIAAQDGMYLLGDGFGFDFDHLESYSCASGDTVNPPFLSAGHIESEHVVTQKATCAFDGTSDTTPKAYQFGLNLGYGGFTVGGSYAKYKDDGNFDRYVYDLGASYETGPWGFSFTYLHSKQQAGVNDGSKINKYLLATTYTMAKGVRLGVFGDYEKVNWDGPHDSNNDSESAWVIGTGMRLDF